MRRWVLIIGAALISINLVGCAVGFGYHAGPPAPYEPYITDLPPSFYDYDPAYRHWYVYPYWNPNRDFFP
jgi:hypothetical protein